MPQKLEIWFVHNSLILVNPYEISYQCLILCRSHVQKGTKIAFLQYFAAYQWTSRRPRDLKFGQYITHSTQFVHAKFHVHAAFFGGATHNTVQKITFLQHFSAFSQQNFQPLAWQHMVGCTIGCIQPSGIGLFAVAFFPRYLNQGAQ